jgi:RHS repeat-associated protein
MDVYTYTYDSANNQTGKHEVINGIDKGTTSYTYDALNRLLAVTEPSGRETGYTYDMAGNRTMELISSASETISNSYSYNEQNRLVYITTRVDSEIAEITEYSYDHNGNQLETIVTEYIDGVAQSPITTVTNTYDKRNQLIQTVTEEGTTLTNCYNGEGLRVSKTVNGQKTYYLYEYDKVVLEVIENGTQKARNLYGTNLLMRTVDNEAYYYIYNGHADVTALIDTDGNIAATYYYDAFGNILEQTGDVDNNITYAGYQYDDETGLYYLNARMYDPKIARFLQEDTYRGDPNDPLSLNLYTYCSNEPIMYADPTGHKGEWWNPGTWADNFVTGIKSITGSNLKSDLEVIKQQNEEGSFNRIIGEVVGGTAYNYKEGYDVIVSGTKEDRRQAFDIIDKNGTTSQSIVAHTSEYIVNGVIAPVRKLFEIPSNAIKTGLKFGWSSDNPLEIVPNTITGVGAGLVGGVLNVPHKDYQFNYNEEWLTKSVSEAWTYAYPESEEYFNTHPLARSVVDSTELVFYVATIKVMQLNQPYDITREANLNNRALSNSKYNTKTTNIDSNKITSEETPKTWTSPDKYVGETANAIEAQYQGKVVNVNKPVYRSDGTLLTDFDIELDNIVIQVKSGGANRLTTQILRTAGGTTKEVIGFAPDLNPSSALVKNASKQGINVFTSLEDLLEYLK